MSHVNTRALLPGGDVKHIKNKKYQRPQQQQPPPAHLPAIQPGSCQSLSWPVSLIQLCTHPGQGSQLQRLPLALAACLAACAPVQASCTGMCYVGIHAASICAGMLWPCTQEGPPCQLISFSPQLAASGKPPTAHSDRPSTTPLAHAGARGWTVSLYR